MLGFYGDITGAGVMRSPSESSKALLVDMPIATLSHKYILNISEAIVSITEVPNIARFSGTIISWTIGVFSTTRSGDL